MISLKKLFRKKSKKLNPDKECFVSFSFNEMDCVEFGFDSETVHFVMKNFDILKEFCEAAFDLTMSDDGNPFLKRDVLRLNHFNQRFCDKDYVIFSYLVLISGRHGYY